MTRNLLGRDNDIYDALKIATLGDVNNSTAQNEGNAGGLQNKIYVWHSDASTVDLFDPTEAGVIAALAAEFDGDTCWLPSVPIDMTTPITIPANTSLVGISHQAILNFTGFSGAAIVLSAGSVIQDFTLNHTDGLWFDATAADSEALRIHGTAQRAIVGAVIVPILSEIWAGEAHGIYWRGVDSGWNAVAALPNSDRIKWFRAARDGSVIYCTTHPTDEDNIFNEKLYKCENPKSASPIWTLIAGPGTALLSTSISSYFDYTLGPCVVDGTHLYTVAHVAAAPDAWAYGVYNGSTWSWSFTNTYLSFGPQGAGRDMYAFEGEIRNAANAGLDSGFNSGYEFYHSPSGIRYCSKGASFTLYIRRIGVSDLQNLGSSGSGNDLIYTNISGAEEGAQVYCVSAASGASGHLWLSDDGASFSDIATWNVGWVKDETWGGGGPLVWLLRSVAEDDPICKRYLRAGSVDADLTDNFWSLTSGNKIFVGLSLVYTV